MFDPFGDAGTRGYLRNLEALTAELSTPDKGILGQYFRPLTRSLDPTLDRIDSILSTQGLNDSPLAKENIVYQAYDPAGSEKYQEMVRRREQSP